ncbi:hypothetical protein SAMN04488023_10171 [Pedobacter rhizosphaerae]|uniref:Uncharacterized protein n=1 Tax=Pedobacter rhizosphaerae TaxID=390241 RepID=A0A1H9ISL3_9SPHI|nr:hypothetical protein SAMN04488023_10171 [Pedobacter rhizosphaerae]
MEVAAPRYEGYNEQRDRSIPINTKPYFTRRNVTFKALIILIGKTIKLC